MVNNKDESQVVWLVLRRYSSHLHVICDPDDFRDWAGVRVTAWDLLLGRHQRIRSERGDRWNGIGRAVIRGVDGFWEGGSLWLSEMEG